MNSQQQSFEEWVVKAYSYTDYSKAELLDKFDDGEYTMRSVSINWDAWQAATEQGAPVRGDSVSIDVSTDEATAGYRVFGTMTGDRNGDRHRTWLAELDQFNYPAATEQGVGEPVAYLKLSEKGNLITTTPLWGFPVWDRPPKPTRGCVPEVDDSKIPRAFDSMMARAYRVGFEDCRAALLATQQPPTQESCHAGRDGDCIWKNCPQIRDNEPETNGRHCPLDNRQDPY